MFFFSLRNVMKNTVLLVEERFENFILFILFYIKWYCILMSIF